MGKLIYAAITSVDGYIADRAAQFGWAVPDDELHAFVNDLVRPAGTFLYGRRMFEVMKVWEDPSFAEGGPAPVADFSKLWRAANKIVYSGTLEGVDTARTRLERRFDADAVRELKASTTAELAIGGAGLAAAAFAAGLIDEVHLFPAPVSVGGGTASLPDFRVNLELVEAQRFASGFAHLHYRVRN
ncbi:dihydrofolate reductase family protein [Sinomonas sp. ASV322]|uniref:dihydrofolate reductase family protein n=1 Tax=Sinomonas sp. ASV322 TaxID=3041920 RepID=UPI0027DC83CC|nr:dihydrofolate reductase family protein [Sinomonas sp. ASV322]MDQ4503073.1 dihydrofolate reductase family protein [Sinomonas sp. ASV322]